MIKGLYHKEESGALLWERIRNQFGQDREESILDTVVNFIVMAYRYNY